MNTTTTRKQTEATEQMHLFFFPFHTIVFKTILAFVKSVAVHSIKTFFVFRVIAEWAPLIIGGKDKTVLPKRKKI